jgi:hypothetical protein
MTYQVLYRGPLSSCNYGCEYCPFAKCEETTAELAEDRQALDQFLQWIAAQEQCRFRVLFTPWGEALIRHWYQEALIFLTHLPQVKSASIQTNLSCGLGWVENCQREKLALWATYHPTEAGREKFVAKVRHLHQQGVRLSVGIVGMREHFAAIARLRQELPANVYVWNQRLQTSSWLLSGGRSTLPHRS